MIPSEDLRPHLSKLERTLHWIESHASMEMVTTLYDPETVWASCEDGVRHIMNPIQGFNPDPQCIC